VLLVASTACSSNRAANSPEPRDEAASSAGAPASADEGSTAADDGPAVEAGGADAASWQDLEPSACLDAYAKCLEDLPEDRKDQLWLPYEQLQAGIESMRSMDPATIGPACNQNMAMFRKHGVC
jgi:hypothetical protein